MLLKLDGKRRLTLPASLVSATPGDYFEARYDEDDDTITLSRVKRKSSWLEVWKQCPVPMDDLPLRSHELPRKLKL